jgi:hypothetical protein
MAQIRAEVARLEEMVLRMNGRIQALEKRERQRQQAILEMAAALEEAGITSAGSWSLPSPPETPVPSSSSADPASKVSA